MPKRLGLLIVTILIGFVLVGKAVQQSRAELQERFRRMSDEYETEGLAEKYTGVTTHGAPAEGLFGIHSTGVSTDPIQRAAEDFLGSLTSEQVAKTVFPVDDPEWRKWMNQHFYIRQGMGFDEMEEVQRNAAFGLLRESLSARGLKLTRDIMKLNHTLGELNGDNFVEYGEWLYWLTVMGEPSSTEPWGWQLDGHHAIINYFVLGDQVVMTPFFFGSEPVIAETGKYMGTSVMQAEQNQGLAMLRALSEVQQEQAIIQVSKTGNDNLGEAFKDNIVLDYAGVPVASWSDAQKDQLLKLIELYIGNLRDGHARVRMEEVTAHLNDTFFAWIGSADDEAVFYYRIHSPVILIEFDHQQPAGLRHLFSSDLPIRQHVHAVIRTPNGNDYGKDLLRQHYEAHPHTP
jgi:hypothetical protein